MEQDVETIPPGEMPLSPYVVKTTVFEGPLDLLLSLIETRKLFINEISLGSVTNEYLDYVRKLPEMSMGDVTSFLVVAATLVLIKSRSLLPNLELTTDEEDKIVDLELRLKLYQIIRDAGAGIGTRYGAQVLQTGPSRIKAVPIFTPDAQVNQVGLRDTLERLIERLPKPAEKVPEITVKRMMSIDEMMQDLALRIEKTFQTSFHDLTSRYVADTPKEHKVYTIVSFLAMLELIRNGILDVVQEYNFDTITIQKL